MTPGGFDRLVWRVAAAVAALYVVIALVPSVTQAHTATVKAPIIWQTHAKGCDYTFSFDVDGCAYPADKHGVYRVYVRSLDDRDTVEHERGHVYDWAHLTDRSRGAWSIIFDRPFDPELFAEGYSRCANHTPVGWPSAYGYDPTWGQHSALCRLIWTNDRFRNR